MNVENKSVWKLRAISYCLNIIIVFYKSISQLMNDYKFKSLPFPENIWDNIQFLKHETSHNIIWVRNASLITCD